MNIKELEAIYLAGEMPSPERLEALGFQPAFGWSYLRSLQYESGIIDFSDFCDREVAGIVRDLKANDIHEFTISQRAEGVLEKAEAFIEYGAKLEGITRIEDGGESVPAPWMRI